MAACTVSEVGILVPMRRLRGDEVTAVCSRKRRRFLLSLRIPWDLHYTRRYSPGIPLLIVVIDFISTK